jgi:hypothetical protein
VQVKEDENSVAALRLSCSSTILISPNPAIVSRGMFIADFHAIADCT